MNEENDAVIFHYENHNNFLRILLTYIPNFMVSQSKKLYYE